MFRSIVLIHAALTCLAPGLPRAMGQVPSFAESGEESRLSMQPTYRELLVEEILDPELQADIPQGALAQPVNEGVPAGPAEVPPLDWKSLLRPRLEFSAEWEPESDGLAISSYDLSVQMPTYPVFGPPPPFINAGYSFTQITAPAALDLPERLHDFSLGLAWMRRINDKWMARFMLSAAFASDMNNTGSDAWQIRGGGFALYRPNERWSWAFGAMATGRNDIPVIPAVGVIWEPVPQWRVNLMMPSPRISYLVAESNTRQHWGYVGGGLSGGNWAYDRTDGAGEQLSYREFRLVLGWESMPPRPPGTFRSTGTRFHSEIGYVFGRQFEFDYRDDDTDLSDALLLRTGISF